MDAMPAVKAPARETEECFRSIACDLDDLRSLLDIITFSQDVPDNMRCALRPIGMVIEQISNRAEAHADNWEDKARAQPDT